MGDPTLSIAFLWHQHQPYYKDTITNTYELPWVRLHATKDYFDMVAILDDFPNIRLNINLVPSLLLQLEDYAKNQVEDRFLTLSLKEASQLTRDEKLFLLENFFMANWDHMIDPYPRYRDLLEKRGRQTTHTDWPRHLTYFKEQDWRDLQVWFNLAWFDPKWEEIDPLIGSLKKKGKGYSEEEKKSLLAKQLEVCGLIIQKHRDVAARGQVELTTTPFYHPILPLLCDTESARIALPQIQLPQRFQHPEDAKHQLKTGIDYFKQHFGNAPKGMWPSEGSVSPEALQRMVDEGIEWAATDESILAHSIGTSFQRNTLYQPFRVPLHSSSIQLIFRDHELSDAIGFVYASWDADKAVADFLTRLERVRQDAIQAKIEHPIVSIILDGENCWEYYPQDGNLFLRALYSALSNHPHFKTVTVSNYLSAHPANKELSQLHSGSWINSNFAIWIGHSEDNKAWDALKLTREFLITYLKKNTHLINSPQAQKAWESIYIAEGSDWCWWYGDDHSSSIDGTFDYLFRKNLMNVYSLLGVPVPESLFQPIKKLTNLPKIVEPVGFITPQIDGRKTSYYEWRAGGMYVVEAGQTGTMHRAENRIQTIYFGFDTNQLYLRIDWMKPLTEEDRKELNLVLHFTHPESLELYRPLDFIKPWGWKKNSVPLPDFLTIAKAAYDKIFEMAIPLQTLQLAAGGNKPPHIHWTVRLEEGGEILEKWPLNSSFQIPWPSPESFADQWTTL